MSSKRDEIEKLCSCVANTVLSYNHDRLHKGELTSRGIVTVGSIADVTIGCDFLPYRHGYFKLDA